MATASPTVLDAKLSRSPGKIGMIIFGIVLVIGFSYAASHLLGDLSTMHSDSALPYILLGIALLVALGFEFVNGFHDTANAVATVIYTHSSGASRRCGLVGLLEFSGSDGFVRDWSRSASSLCCRSN